MKESLMSDGVLLGCENVTREWVEVVKVQADASNLLVVLLVGVIVCLVVLLWLRERSRG